MIQAIAIAALCGCAPRSGDSNDPDGSGGKSSESGQPFPSARELAELGRTPIPASVHTLPVAVADTWTMVGPLPTTLGESPYRGSEPDAEVVRSALHGGQRLDDGMMCAARQYGSFLLEHGGTPARDIEAFMLARCGVTAIGLSARTLSRPGAPFPLTADIVAKPLAALPSDAPVGFWVGSNGETAMSIFVASPAVARVEPTAFEHLSGEQIEIRGTLQFPIGSLFAGSTWGELAARRCEELPTTAPTELALRCPVDSSREFSFIEVVVTPPGRVLGQRVLGLLASSGAAPTSYTTPSLELPITDADHDSVAWVSGVNELRRGRERPPLTLAKAQSTAIEPVLPHLTSPAIDPQTRDRIALGVIAGWRVDGTIRSARFLIATDGAGRPLEPSLSGLLMSPLYRDLLLSRRADVIATAQHATEGSATRATLLVTYELFGSEDHGTDVGALFDELDRQRAGRGRGPVTRIGGPKSLAIVHEATERLRTGQSNTTEALDWLLNTLTAEYQRGFIASIYTTLLLDGWRPDFPQSLLEAEASDVVIAIGYFKPEGAAWGQHTVFVVYTVD